MAPLPKGAEWVYAIQFVERFNRDMPRIFPWEISTKIPLFWLPKLMLYYRLKNEIAEDEAKRQDWKK